MHRSGDHGGASKPAFLITIDTEGDNLWGRPRTITTRNSRFLPQFQECCETYGLRPTYLAAWEMLHCPVFLEFAHDVVSRGTAEIGMHLHAWNSPPLEPLTNDDLQHLPYLVEYPEPLMREKINVMTRTLEDIFGSDVVSHRAGRWALNEQYARLLVDAGYRVDCSVTPHISWASTPGSPHGSGGTDYRGYPEYAYFVELTDLRQVGGSPLLEIPMTVLYKPRPALVRSLGPITGRWPLARRLVDRLFPERWWLRPNRHNRRRLLAVVAIAQQERRDYIEFMLHSSELMPGGSPMFPTSRSVDALYDDLEALFDRVHDQFEGLTLAEYRKRHNRAGTNQSVPASR